MGEYGQLFQIYNVLRRQDTVNQRAILVAAVSSAVTVVGNLNVTISAITAIGDNGVLLAGMKSVVHGALRQVQDVQFDEQ
jgi:hemoglobin-like flavoprotein